MSTHVHDCEITAIERTATPEQPYHFVDSGLANVYLVGVKYWLCVDCEKQSAEIPSLKNLLPAIARVIVEKQSPLTGSQLKFLRKRLGKRSIDFAAMVGVTPERYSAVEAKESPLSEGRDKLVRLIYRDLSGDRKLKDALGSEDQIAKWLTALHGRGASERIVATWLNNKKWRVETAPLALVA